MRLFLALWPDAAATARTDAWLAAHVDPASWRTVDPDRRHITLSFLGDGADPQEARDALHRFPRRGPALRLAGAGRFGDALWLGVEPDEPDVLAALVAAAGEDPDRHVAHLTVARRRHGSPDVAVPPGPPGLGRWWRPGEVALVASGRPYRVLDRVELT